MFEMFFWYKYEASVWGLFLGAGWGGVVITSQVLFPAFLAFLSLHTLSQMLSFCCREESQSIS